jgi:hypothetical protein
MSLGDRLYAEIELNSKFYSKAFNSESFSYFSSAYFKQISVRLLAKQFIAHMLETVRAGVGDKNSLIDKLRPEHIKMHLNLYILTHRFLIDNHLEKLELNDLLSYTFFNEGGGKSDRGSDTAAVNAPTSLNELFQPFLLEYIRQQEDQFIKYIHKIYDIDRINCLAEDMSSLINNSRQSLTMSVSFHAHTRSHNLHSSRHSPVVHGSSSGIVDSVGGEMSIYRLENYHSPSVTDLFTIIHELLQTILQFDSENSELNLPHQICFVNLIKNKLLTYSAHIKKEYHKVCKSDSSSHEG